MRRPLHRSEAPGPAPARAATAGLAALIAGLASALAGLLAAPSAGAAELPIFDAHVHYSHDAWAALPPKEAVSLLRRAGLRRVRVSSSSGEGTQQRYAEAPDLIVPSLRPYRTRNEIGTWVRDESVIAHLESRLANPRYVAIGEFHVYGADADLPVMRRVVALTHRHGLLLHLHGDVDAVERVSGQDLAHRSDPATDGRVAAEWRETFTEFPNRFMLGTDTFSPERWWYVPEHAAWARRWLADLPAPLAEGIAWRNAEAMLAARRPPITP
jgi:hypothetical protein